MTTPRRAFTLVELLVVVGILFVLFLLLLPMTRGGGGREAARRNECLNNLRQISLALLQYEETHGTLPPAYTTGPQGQRLHSWRTVILPEMQRKDLYAKIDLSLSWDAAAHQSVWRTEYSKYLCASSATETLEGTTYLGVFGPRSAFFGNSPQKLLTQQNGSAESIMVVDVDDAKVIPWMQPQDVSQAEVVTYFTSDWKKRIQHFDVLMVVYEDGHGKAMKLNTDLKIIRSQLGRHPLVDAAEIAE